ncbi:hypothetical protein EON66_02045, partial [archaeon]
MSFRLGVVDVRVVWRRPQMDRIRAHCAHGDAACRGFLVAVLMLCSYMAQCDAVGETTYTGCTCVTDCGRSLDSISSPWCLTSPVDPPLSYVGCGKYSPSRRAFWDLCDLANTGTKIVLLSTFDSMWSVMTVAIIGTGTTLFFVAGMVASFTFQRRRALLWLPCMSGLCGA